MQEDSVDQPPSLSHLLRESYLAEARAQQRHSEMSRSDSSSSRRLFFGPLKGKAEDCGGHEEPQLPDLSAFLSQEELDKSVNLARQAIGHEPSEERSKVAAPVAPPAAPSATNSDITPLPVTSSSAPPSASCDADLPADTLVSSFTTPATIPFAPTFTAPSATSTTQPATETKNPPATQTTFSAADRKMQQAPMQDNVVRNGKGPGEAANDFNRSARNAPYGMETQSKKEFLNKAADFIEELSSLFKANSTKRVRPRACKAHRSRTQKGNQVDGTVYTQALDERERPVVPVEPETETPREADRYEPELQLDSGVGPVEVAPQECGVAGEQYFSASEEVEEDESPAPAETPYSAEPSCEPPRFIQKLKSREVPEGSKVRLDCIVTGLPVPEVRWFCEGKELENSPDIQILTNGEQHTLIITEAFEEDTGRYSCFASNFYGTDSTSAEIYIEGASSTDSEGEQHIEHGAQPQRRSAAAAPLPPVTSPTISVREEDSRASHSTGVIGERPVPLPSQPADQTPPVPPLPVQIPAAVPPVPVQQPIISSPPPVPTSDISHPLSVQISTAVPPLPVQLSNTLPSEPVQLPATVVEASDLLKAPVVSIVQPAQEDTTVLPFHVAPALPPEETEPLEAPEEPTPVLVTSIPQPVQTTASLPFSPTLPSIQAASTQTVPESESYDSYHQRFDGRPIMAAPVFTKSLQDLHATEGQLVVLECRVKGVPSPKVEWYREGTFIEDSPDFRLLQKKPRSTADSEEICTLVIAEVFPEDSGMFTCTASNKYGTVSSVATLRVKAKNTNSNHVQSLSRFPVDSRQMQDPSIAEIPAPPPKPQVEAPVINSIKPHSSTIRLDPLTTSTIRLDPLSTSTLRLDPHSSSMLRPDPISASLPSLDALNLSANHSLGTRSTSTSRLDPLYLSTLHQDLPGSIGVHQGPQNSGEVLSYLKPFPASLSVAETQSSSLKTNQEVSRPALPDLLTSVTPDVTPNHHNGTPTVIPLPDPPTNSCLKSQANHREKQRSGSRAGRRVHFKLPEDEEEEASDDSSHSHEEAMQAAANKEPPPVLAKPKLDPAQLQLLHNQVLMEQQQETDPQPLSQPQPKFQPQPQPQPKPQLMTQLQPPLMTQPQPQPQPQPMTQPQPQLMTQPQPQLMTQPQPQLMSQPQPQPQLMTQPQPQPHPQPEPLPQEPPSVPMQPQPQPQSQPEPAVWSPRMHHVPKPQAPQQKPHAEPPLITPPPVAAPQATPVRPLTPPSVPQLNTTPAPPVGALPATPHLKTAPVITSPPPVPQLNTAPAPFLSAAAAVSQMNTIHASHLNLSPASLSRPQGPTQFNFPPAPHLSSAPVDSFSSVPASRGPTMPQISSPTPMLRTTHASLMNLAPNSQNFGYARPKEFLATQILSPIRSPSPTESPVPLLHELAAELNSSAASSPTIPPFSPPPKLLPTRVLMSPTSPPGFVASPTLQSAPYLNSVFSVRAQSPPQASSPTSSSSTPSPIQNPVAFLSSVLPSLPTMPATNAMGLPKRAPVGPQSILKKAPRGRVASDEDIRESKENLLHDIEKKLRFTDDTPRYVHQQKPTNEGQTTSRPLGAKTPATVINYDEEYRVSNFEQRLMSEIEFRLERTPVEESDDEVQHDAIPTGKCIAPIFDKKLKNFRAMEGVPVTFSCKVVGIPVPKVYWFKDGKQILRKNTHYKKIREGDGTCVLHIEATTNDDDGNYTVMAANPQGRISCSGHLIIQTGPPRSRMTPIHSQRVRARIQEVEEGEQTQERFFRPHFLQAPGDQEAHEGRLCRLDCKVSGLPSPELMWLVNGRPIYSDQCHKMLVRENGVHSLVIDPLTQKDGGTYTCIASNKAGQSSFCLELKVVAKELKCPPQFVEKLQNTGIAEGSPVRLDCRVIGMPPPAIFWKKDNDSIPRSRDRFSMHLDATGYVCLVIQPSRKEDAGWYTVSAKNEAGIVSCTARLDIYAQWHQSIHTPVKKAPRTGSRYAALTGQGLDIKSVFPTSETSPILFSSSPPEAMLESEEL